MRTCSILLGIAALWLLTSNWTNANTNGSSKQLSRAEFMEMMNFEEFGHEIPRILGYGTLLIPHLSAVLTDDSQPEIFIARSIIIAGKLGAEGHQLSEQIERHLLNSSGRLRGDAMDSLVELKRDQMLPILLSMVYDEDRSVRYRALRYLGSYKKEETLIPLKIWRAAAQRMDQNRSDHDKWLRPKEQALYDQVTQVERTP